MKQEKQSAAASTQVKSDGLVQSKKASPTLKTEKTETLTIEKYLIRALLSSPGSGAGKTTSAITIPKLGTWEPGGKVLLLDLDNRSEVLAGFPNIEIIKFPESESKSPQAWLKADAVRKMLWRMVRELDEFPYDGVITDGMAALFRFCMNWSLTLDQKRGLGGSPAQQHYGPQMKNATDFILSMLGLPCHVVFTGHEDLVEQDGGQLAGYLPKVTGKLKTEVPKWFNETYCCYRISEAKDTGGLHYKFWWHTQGTPKRDYLKSSMNQLQKYWDDPIQVDFDAERKGFCDLLYRRFGTQTEGGDKKSE